MSGMHYVDLAKRQGVICASCKGFSTVRTEKTGTVVHWRHKPWCRIGRIIALAGPYEWRELLPTDDRRR